MPMEFEPLQHLKATWLNKIKLANDLKKSQFSDEADELTKFYIGPHDFMYEGAYSARSRAFRAGSDEGIMPAPAFQMTANKTFEFVSVVGPMLYPENIFRRVEPRDVVAAPTELFPGPEVLQQMQEQGQPIDPQLEQMVMFIQQATQEVERSKSVDKYRAMLLERTLNFTPQELDLESHARLWIDEALIKGRGVLWTELFVDEQSGWRAPISTFDSVDNLLIDPDAESVREAKWVARKRRMPTWEAERKFGLKPKSLKGNLESLNQAASSGADPLGLDKRKREETADLVEFYEIWSRMGLGARLKGAQWQTTDVLEEFGDYCYLAVARTVSYPLNLPPELTESAPPEAVHQAVQWPIPFYADAPNPWPFTELDFHSVPGQVWPLAHMAPALGYQKFLNWAYSMLAAKLRITTRDILAVDEGQDAEVLTALERGEDLSMIPLKRRGNENWKDVMGWIQAPAMNPDIKWVLQVITTEFEKNTGLNEIMYGMSGTQMRSAAESEMKGNYGAMRPKEMFGKTKKALGIVARKEAMAARWLMRGQDVEPIVGKVGAFMWDQLVRTTDIPYVVREFDYRIDSSTSLPDRDLLLKNTNEAAQFMFPVLMQDYAATGDPSVVNQFMEDWAKARNFNADKYLLPKREPPPPPPPDPTQTAIHELKAKQAELGVTREVEKTKQSVLRTVQKEAEAFGNGVQTTVKSKPR